MMNVGGMAMSAALLVSGGVVASGQVGQGFVTPRTTCSSDAIVGGWSGYNNPFTLNFTWQKDGSYTYSVSEGLEEILSTQGTFVVRDRGGELDRNWPSNCSLILRTTKVLQSDAAGLRRIRRQGMLMDDGRERLLVLDNATAVTDDGRRRVLNSPLEKIRMTIDGALIDSGGAYLKRSARISAAGSERLATQEIEKPADFQNTPSERRLVTHYHDYTDDVYLDLGNGGLRAPRHRDHSARNLSQ